MALLPLPESRLHVLQDTGIGDLSLQLRNPSIDAKMNFPEFRSSGPDTVNGKGIKELIGKDNPVNSVRGILPQLNRAVIHPIEDPGMSVLESGQDVPAQESLAHAQFHQMEGTGPGEKLDIMNECIRQTIGKHLMRVGGSVVIPFRPEDLLLGGVVALLRVIKTEVHEAFEGNLLVFPGKNHIQLPTRPGNNCQHETSGPL